MRDTSRLRNINGRKKTFQLRNIMLNHIYSNLKSYIIVTIILLIGIIAGVIFINHINESQEKEIGEYINHFITSLKGEYKINKGELLKHSLMRKFKTNTWYVVYWINCYWTSYCFGNCII